MIDIPTEKEIGKILDEGFIIIIDKDSLTIVNS